jgi:hypothetical protein
MGNGFRQDIMNLRLGNKQNNGKLNDRITNR